MRKNYIVADTPEDAIFNWQPDFDYDLGWSEGDLFHEIASRPLEAKKLLKIYKDEKHETDLLTKALDLSLVPHARNIRDVNKYNALEHDEVKKLRAKFSDDLCKIKEKADNALTSWIELNYSWLGENREYLFNKHYKQSVLEYLPAVLDGKMHHRAEHHYYTEEEWEYFKDAECSVLAEDECNLEDPETDAKWR